MAAKVVEMTTEELHALIEAVIDRKLSEWLGDPDEGMELKQELRERILRQRQAYNTGKRSHTLDEVAQRFESD